MAEQFTHGEEDREEWAGLERFPGISWLIEYLGEIRGKMSKKVRKKKTPTILM